MKTLKKITCRMKKINNHFVKCAVGTALLFTLTAVADIQNPGFELGDLIGWSLTGNGAFGDSPRSIPRFNQPTEGSYYADSGYDATNGWVESNTGTLQSAVFTLGSNEVVQFDIGGWSKWSGGGFEYCYVGLYLADDGSELDREWTPNGNNAIGGSVDPKTNMNIDVYIKVVDDGTNSGYAWMSVDNFRIIDTDSPNRDFEYGYINWDVSGPAWGTGPVTTNYDPFFFEHNPIHGKYYANSKVGGETATGTLRSATFTYPKDGCVSFLIAGHSTRFSPTIYNYVTLKDAVTHADYGTVYTPDQDLVVEKAITNIAANNKQVYFEIVDNCEETGYAWIAVDYFQLISLVPHVPQGVSATKGTTNDRVIVTWYSEADVTKYQVYRNNIAVTNSAVNISGELGDVTQFDDITALGNSNYYYWVQAGNDYGWSGFSDYDIGFRTSSIGPDIPTNILPINGSTPEFPIFLTASAYSDPGGWPFAASEWQISSRVDFSTKTEYHSGGFTNVTPPSGNYYNGTNYWRVRYGNDKNRWSDWSDSTFFIVNRDTNSTFYFMDTFNNVSESGDVNNNINASARQFGKIAPLDYSITGSNVVGTLANVPNKLVLYGESACSPNYSFEDYNSFKIECDMSPDTLGSAITFGKSTQNDAPTNVGGFALIFYGDGSGKYDVYESTTLVGTFMNDEIKTSPFHVSVSASTVDFDNDHAFIAAYINGKPLILWPRELAWQFNTNHFNYVYEKVNGFGGNYISLCNLGGQSAFDNLKISEISTNFSTFMWLNDADSGIDLANNYTHAINFNDADDITINGVPFLGGGTNVSVSTDGGSNNYFTTGSTSLTGEYFGSAYEVIPADGYMDTDGKYWEPWMPNVKVTGNGKDLLKHFIFNVWDGIQIKLDVTPNSSNVFTLHSMCWWPKDNGGVFLLAGNDGSAPMEVSVSQFEQYTGAVIQYEYKAPADGKFIFTISDWPHPVFAFSNYETGIPEPEIEVVNSLDFGEIVLGNPKTLQFPVFNTGAGTVSGEFSGIIAPFSLNAGSNYYAVHESPDFIYITFDPLADGDFSNIVFLTGNGGNAQIELKGTAVPEGGIIFSMIAFCALLRCCVRCSV